MKLEYPERTHAFMERKCKLHTEGPKAVSRFEPSANHYTIMPPSGINDLDIESTEVTYLRLCTSQLEMKKDESQNIFKYLQSRSPFNLP